MTVLIAGGYLLLSFIITTMLAQLASEGRFGLATILAVTLLGAVGAWLGQRFLHSSLLTGALLGAALASGVALFALHRLGWFLPPAREESDSE